MPASSYEYTEPSGRKDYDAPDDSPTDDAPSERHWLVVPKLNAKAKNIAEQMTPEQRKKLGALVVEDTEADLQSRKDLADRWAQQAKLYLGRPESSPLAQRNGAPNIHIPGASIAVDLFVARAIKYLLPPGRIAKCEGNVEDRGRVWRVAKVMNLFFEKLITGFRRSFELTIKQAALFGPAAQKTWWDPAAKTIATAPVAAQDLIVSHAHSGTLDTAPRVTNRIYLSRDAIRSRINAGIFCESAWTLNEDSKVSREREALEDTRDDADGYSEGAEASDPGPLEIYEQHRMLDLDGDGIGEPYIVTVHAESKHLLRVVTRKDGDDTVRFFTCYEFDYNPLAFYGLGIGPKTEGLSILQNSLANVMLFLGIRNSFPPKFCSAKAFKKPGDQEYELDEWIEASMQVDDLSKHMFIAPTVPPSNVLMDLFQEAGRAQREVVSVTEISMGKNQPHNQAARTSEIIDENSKSMFNGAFNRLLDALGHQLGIVYALLRRHLSDADYNEMLGDTGQPEYLAWLQAREAWQQMTGQLLTFLNAGMPPPPELVMQLSQMQPPPEHPFSVKADFSDDLDIVPTADPNLTSESDRMAVAEAVLAQVLPDPQASPHARWAARQQFYEALRVPADVMAAINPEPEPPQPPPNLGPQEALVAMLRGQPVAVLPDQAHSEYIAAIEEYKQRDEGAWWQNTAPETREAIERHKQERMAAHLEQEAARGQQASIPALVGAAAPAAPIIGGPEMVGGAPGMPFSIGGLGANGAGPL